MRKADVFVAAAAIAVLLLYLIFSQEGAKAKIYVNSELYTTLSLNKDSHITVKSDFGKNDIVIKNGSVSVINSDCENHLCEKRTINKCGQSIVCLPNRLLIVIESAKKEREADVII